MKVGDKMRKLEMEYFNTYYFCSLIQYLIEDAGIDYARTLAEFTDLIGGSVRIDFSKESYLHSFVEFVVERVLYEQNKYMASDIECAIDKDGFAKVIKEKHKVFYGNCLDEYKYTTFELAIIHYHGSVEKIRDWIADNISDDEFDCLDVASRYTEYLEENYYDTVESLKREVLYLLFQNRTFLMKFNIFMSDVIPGKSERKYLPQWVKRAVFYRDNGKCVICQKDLSGLIDVEEEYQKQFDHIVPLENGGMNDISNIQLMCSCCNQKKGIQTYTSNVYRFLYDE